MQRAARDIRPEVARLPRGREEQPEGPVHVPRLGPPHGTPEEPLVAVLEAEDPAPADDRREGAQERELGIRREEEAHWDADAPKDRRALVLGEPDPHFWSSM